MQGLGSGRDLKEDSGVVHGRGGGPRWSPLALNDGVAAPQGDEGHSGT